MSDLISDPPTPLTDATKETVDRLLHDAEHAKSGAWMASMMVGKIASAKQDADDLNAKHLRLVAEAEALDPQHTAQGWSEADV